MNNWYDDLCEYYSVEPEVALKLGTRSSGRKPDLPGSRTCEPVSGMTFEDIWEMKDRSTIENVFQFYIDQGAWSSFRQCVRHSEIPNYHVNILSSLLSACKMRKGFHICEYGCGVAPFVNALVENLKESSEKIRISITDIDGCEHFKFAEWRLNKKISKGNLPIDLDVKPVTHDLLPTYSDKIDLALIFEVLEHVPSPVETIKNIHRQLIDGGLVVENFIKHPEEEIHDDGPDLVSAARERDQYYEFLFKNFKLIGGQSLSENQDGTRIWRKNEKN